MPNIIKRSPSRVAGYIRRQLCEMKGEMRQRGQDPDDIIESDPQTDDESAQWEAGYYRAMRDMADKLGLDIKECKLCQD